MEHLGILLTGSLGLRGRDVAGAEASSTVLKAPTPFLEACSWLREKCPADVTAVAQSAILFLSVARIQEYQSNFGAFHPRFIHNFVTLLAEKCKEYYERLQILGSHTIRERILFYLAQQIRHHGEGNSVAIPLNQRELAGYLCVDRSALSRELGRMRREGIIDFNKNQFILLKQGR